MGITGMILRAGRTFARRGGPVAVGVLAVCAIVWFAGPRLGLGDTTLRLSIIGGVLGLAVLAVAVRWFILRRRGNRLQQEMAEQEDPRAAEREADIEAVREKMADAIQQLKTSELGGGQRGAAALYALPWYLIIGPSAAGKSTLLCNSGLHFPYTSSDDLHLRGFGGTRNCDWWFADEAVILDTAGRYTTDEDDHPEWISFLGMLRRHRRRMPINGVLVAISVSDLLTADSDELERHVRIIRDRIDELIRELGLVFPVYLVFTKCDLIKGFEAYFSDLSDAEREQVWGAYLLESVDEDTEPAEVFSERMDALYRRLCELRLRKMSMQRNLARKGELHDFPHQFLAASETLGDFVRLLFRGNPYQETPLLAGVYFTSSTQEGTPLQRAIGGLRQAFGLADSTGAERDAPKRPFFVKRLFTDVIFRLPGAVRRNRRRLLWGRWLKGAAVAGGLAVIGLTLLGLSGAYTANALLLADGRGRAEAVRAAVEGDDPRATYAALASLYTYYEKLRRYESERPWSLRFGIYSADELLPGLERLLFRALGRHFRDPVLTALEYHLENLGREWQSAEPEAREAMRDRYYAALRTYLTTAHFNARVDNARAVPVLSDLWARDLGLAADGQGYDDVRRRAPELADLVGFYLDRIGQEPALRRWALREALVAQARDQLITPPDPDRLYARIRHRGLGELGSYTVSNLLSEENRPFLAAETRLEVLYTAKGWYEYTREAIESVVTSASRGDWVLTAPLDRDSVEMPERSADEVDERLVAEMRAGLRQRYFDDYADHWLEFLAGVSPKPYGSLDEAATMLLRLARSDGPIGELMQVTARNINLYETRPPSGQVATPAALESSHRRVPELRASLAGLRRFANPSENKTTSDLVNQYLLLLNELKNATERLAASADLARDAESYTARVLSTGGSDTELYRVWVSTGSLLNGTGAETLEAVEALFTEPTENLWRSIVALAREQLQSRWRAEVLSVYRDRLEGRFPFDTGGPDASLDDVAAFFRPGSGILWSFVDRELGAYLERTRGGWRQRSWLGVQPGFSAAFLRHLETAARVTDVFFREGGDRPSVSFHVYPLPTAGLSEILIESNGQAYRYRNGPQEWRRFRWPGDLDTIGARIAATISRGSARAEREFAGPWGIFHLFREARLTRQTSSVFKAEWAVEVGSRDPVDVRFMVRASRRQALFSGELMERFDPPGGVFAGRVLAAPAVAEAR